MFSRRVWLSGSRAGGTRQSGSPGRGPQLASQAPWSARTASRSRHRSSGVTQCGWACVPPVTASSAAARRRADGGASGVQDRPRLPDRLVNLQVRHAHHQQSSRRPLHIRKPHQGHLVGEAIRVPGLLPVRPQHPPARQSAARRPRCRLGQMIKPPPPQNPERAL